MKKPTIIIVIIAVLVATFAAGRYSVKSVDVKTTNTEQVNKDVHVVTRTVTIKQPDGTTKTTTTTKSDDRTKTIETQSAVANTNERSTINVSLLAGSQLTLGASRVLDYGLSVNKEVLGPVTVGVFGMRSGAFGISIGLNF
jgi:hypothetical protein